MFPFLLVYGSTRRGRIVASWELQTAGSWHIVNRMSHTISLTERRSCVRRVPRTDVAELLRAFSHILDVQPTAHRNHFRLTARGVVGWFSTSSVRWVIRSKFPWADLTRLAGGMVPEWGADNHGEPADSPEPFVDLLASRLAKLMQERTAAGLLCGYREEESESSSVRGRIDFTRWHSTPAMLFPLVADEFTSDVLWNRIPFTVAGILLARPDLSPQVRTELAMARDTFIGVADDCSALASFDRLIFDARTEPYRLLIEWCRLIHGSTNVGGSAINGVLLNLEHLFQLHIGRVLNSSQISAQFPMTLQPTTGDTALTLCPDFATFHDDGTAKSVWDAKWKSLSTTGPDPTDLQQALAYAAALGVRTAGLIYPGRTFSLREYVAPSGVRVFAVKLRIIGDCLRAERRLQRLVMME